MYSIVQTHLYVVNKTIPANDEADHVAWRRGATIMIRVTPTPHNTSELIRLGITDQSRCDQRHINSVQLRQERLVQVARPSCVHQWRGTHNNVQSYACFKMFVIILIIFLSAALSNQSFTHNWPIAMRLWVFGLHRNCVTLFHLLNKQCTAYNTCNRQLFVIHINISYNIKRCIGHQTCIGVYTRWNNIYNNTFIIVV